ncbi:MAG: hypothetical protein V8Q82_06790 [Christensenellales bacterium]
MVPTDHSAACGKEHAHDQRNAVLHHAHGIAARPVHGQELAYLEGFLFIIRACAGEFFHFILLPAKGAHHAHAGQVFLQHGAEATLGYVRIAERP